METKHISAAPGQPSTFWSKDGEHWYRTKAEAEANNTAKAVNPDSYAIQKSIWDKYKILWIILIIAAVAGLGFYGYKKGWFNKLIKR